MEHRFPALQPSDGQGHMGPAVRGHVGRPGLRVRGSGRHHRSGAPVRGGGKGDGTKFHLARRTSRCDAVCGLGRPVRVVLTAGQAGDAPHAHALIQSQPAAVVIAASPTTPTTSVTPSPPSGPKRWSRTALRARAGCRPIPTSTKHAIPSSAASAASSGSDASPPIARRRHEITVPSSHSRLQLFVSGKCP